MGYIYSRADEVVVVLANTSLPALESFNKWGRIESEQLQIIERDEWVSRAWTYHETVNSRKLSFSAEGAKDTVVPSLEFLNCIGDALSKTPGSYQDQARQYPRLSAFEDVIADYYTAGYEERSALQIMSSMDRRCQGRAEDHLYAMIGALSTARAGSGGSVEPCEIFMRMCEKKGDYSFIYSAVPRDQKPLRKWRPVLRNLPSILPWHSCGGRQPGRLDQDVLWLDEIVVVHRTEIQEDGADFIRHWLSSYLGDSTERQPLNEAVYTSLVSRGFAGSQHCVNVAGGLFYPFEAVESSCIIDIMVSANLIWIFGAPGLMSY